MRYVDGFVLVIPKKNLAAYKKMATMGGKIWKKHGALEYMENVLDDATPPNISFTFPIMTKAKKGDVVVFSYIVYKSRKHRDAVNKKVMADPAMDPSTFGDMPMPFDMNRMAFGGFTSMVDF